MNVYLSIDFINFDTDSAGDKVALIIGISTYRSYGQPLPAVENDLKYTVQVLEKMGFKVVSLIDLTLVEMNNAVDMFCDLLSSEVYGNQKFNLLFLIVLFLHSSKV